MGALRGWHIVLLVVAALLLFGWKRMPDMARSLGRSMRILKAETKSLSEDDVEAKADAPHTRQPLTPDAIDGEVNTTAGEKQKER
jgi:sec-independent protein translocase protein TatA